MNIKMLFCRKIKPKEYTREEALQMIREGTAAAEDCGFAPDKLHCKGCANACSLAKVRCDLGVRVVRGLHKP